MNRVVLLREWAETVASVRDGRQVVLIRKGGISEGSGGFVAEAGEFVLLPTWFHQHGGQALALPEVIRLEVRCELVKAVEVPSGADLSGLAGFHAYEAGQLRVRAAYKPERPLMVMVVRPYRWAEALELPSSLVAASCRSWAVWERAGEMPASEPVAVEDRVERALAAVEGLVREVAYAGA